MKILLLSIGFVTLAIGMMAIKIFFSPEATFTGGTCASKSSPELKAKGISCNCSSDETKCDNNEKDTHEHIVPVKNLKV